MSEVRDVSQEFWRPAQPQRLGMESVFPLACCANCGTEFAIGARFCHVCGANRDPVQVENSRLKQWLDLNTMREALGLNTAALLLFLAACACVLGALLSGIVYGATTVQEWQAVQTWRIEWMLAAIVALLAGLLLRKAGA